MRNPSPQRVGWRRELVLLANSLRLASSYGLGADHSRPPFSSCCWQPWRLALKPRFLYGSRAFVPFMNLLKPAPGAPHPRSLTALG